jgi:hypothetical protein
MYFLPFYFCCLFCFVSPFPLVFFIAFFCVFRNEQRGEFKNTQGTCFKKAVARGGRRATGGTAPPPQAQIGCYSPCAGQLKASKQARRTTEKKDAARMGC